MNLNSFDYISSQLDYGLLMNLTNYVQYGSAYVVRVHVPIFFWGVAGLEDFACDTLPTTPP